MQAVGYMWLLLSLGCFTALLYFLYRGGEFWGNKKFSREIKVIDRKLIDTGVVLVIVEVRSVSYLMGVSSKDIKIVERL